MENEKKNKFRVSSLNGDLSFYSYLIFNLSMETNALKRDTINKLSLFVSLKNNISE